MAMRQGWFERRMSYVIYAHSATDLRAGTKVEMSGLPVGKITDVTLNPQRRIQITLAVRRRYAQQITIGTQARILRPFIVGEKSIELLPAEGTQLALDGSELELQESSSGNPLAKLTSLIENLEGVARQANKKGQLEQTVTNLAALTREMKKALPYYTKNADEMSKNLHGITRNLNSISEQMNALMPALNEMAKTAPETSKILTESLLETKILVKAIQRNFFIRGNAEDVRREEEEKKRAPASVPEQKIP